MHRPITTDHDQHDLLLIAGHAAGDLPDTDRAMADAMLAACESCAELRRDLIAIAAATRAVPAPALPARDFRLTTDQAARLRRGSWLRRLLRPFAAPRSAVRPMAAAFTTIGVAGLFVTTLFSGIGGSAGAPIGAPSGAERELAMDALHASQPPTAPRASGSEFGGIVQGANQSPGFNDNAKASNPPVRTGYDGQGTAGGSSGPAPAPYGSAAPLAAGGGNGEASTDSTSELQRRAVGTLGSNPLLAGSLAFLGIGLLLFGLRFVGRRIR